MNYSSFYKKPMALIFSITLNAPNIYNTSNMGMNANITINSNKDKNKTIKYNK